MKRQTLNPSKVARVAALKQLLTTAKSVAVVDYTGLKVAQATQLRRDIKAAGGEMKVEKNTLFKLAVDKKDLNINGLSAFIFSLQDEVSALKVLQDFIKKSGVGEFKAGLWNDQILGSAEIESLAKTPPLEMSIAKLMFILEYHTSKLVRTLDAIIKSQGGVTN